MVSEFVPSTSDEHLAFSDITCTLGILVSTLIFLLHKVFLSFSEPSEESLAESSDEFLSQFFASICQNSADAELIYRNHSAEKQLDVFWIFVVVNGLLALSFTS